MALAIGTLGDPCHRIVGSLIQHRIPGVHPSGLFEALGHGSFCHNPSLYGESGHAYTGTNSQLLGRRERHGVGAADILTSPTMFEALCKWLLYVLPSDLESRVCNPTVSIRNFNMRAGVITQSINA